MVDLSRWNLMERLDGNDADNVEDIVQTISEFTDHLDERDKEAVMRILAERIQIPAPLPSDLPATKTQENFDRGGYDIVIYQSEQLTTLNGRWPEYVVQQSLAGALDHTEHNYAIEYGHTPLAAPTEDPYTDDPSVLEWFANEVDRPSDAHVNLLLTDNNGGGVTGGGERGMTCIAGVSALVPGTDPMVAGQSDEARHQYAALHEIGHALGIPGDADEHPYEKPTLTLGRSWTENGKWHKTLVCSSENGGENYCGNPLVARDDEPVVYHNRYSECAIESFRPPQELLGE